MISALLRAAAAAPTSVTAEYAFARDAQRLGQWTAFRKYADHDAVMFTPQAVWVRDFLKGRKDPPKAISWWPTRSFVSCDGRTAVNTGRWVAPNGKSHGGFTTVWQRSGGKWRWVYDAGQDVGGAVPTRVKPQVYRATCRSKAPGAPTIAPRPLTERQARTTPEDSGRGQSADRTLGWGWKVEKDGARYLRVLMWNGSQYAQVLYDNAPAPPPR